MDRIDTLRKKVSGLYLAKNPARDEWADWLFENHIFVTADYAGALAKRFGARKELARAAGMLHDIADTVASRFDAAHDEKSADIARTLLVESGFSGEEISVIVDDAIRFHSCRNGNTPKTLEGRVMATADALAHLQTGFYTHALESKQGSQTDEEIKQWALPKIERDFSQKIFFPEVREEARPAYEKLKASFSSLGAIDK